MMNPLLIVLYLFLAYIVSGIRGQSSCPTQDISPCNCTENSNQGATVDCSSARSGAEISSALSKISLPSSQLWVFLIQDNAAVLELKEGTFQRLSFHSIKILRSSIKSFHPSALSPLQHQLESLEISLSRLDEFSFHNLSELHRLKELRLHNNLLTSVAAFKSDSLEILSLQNNQITSVEFDGRTTPRLRELHLNNNFLTFVPAFRSDSLEILFLHTNKITSVEFDGWATPNLREFDIGNNPLLKFPSAIVNGMKKLEKLQGYGANLSPTLSSGFLEFQSSALKLVDLRNNSIFRLEPGAIAGLTPETTVHLNENKISVVSEGSFRPILDILSMGNGILDLRDNPIQCDCEMSWLVHGQKYLRSVSGKCHNGTEFKDLDSGSLNPCPRECPYQCINSAWLSLCTSETVSHSHVHNCRPGELCCQPFIPKATTITSSSVPDFLIVCGRKNYQVTLSKGGKPSQIGKWPWQAAIYDVKKQDVVCGGALIQEQWVLTAAHCVTIQGTDRPRAQKDIMVYLGKHHRANMEDDDYVQIRQVAGWGYDGSDLLTAVLTEVQLPVISNRLCRRDTALFTGGFSTTRTLTSNMFCAGHSRSTSPQVILQYYITFVKDERDIENDDVRYHSDYRTVCPGDSGSPIVFLSNASQDSYWTVEGIVSHFFQKETCSLRRPGQYGVFTRVNRFTRWIEEVFENS
ncbi:unnamed protein product [Darwinula stevensoni]|uniref:Peptidase S1 domain-containing protein n=1 Tax=Darwinula stevensoni TaxID=69355 RepID=A0A7R9AA60_9CRUS|nr:unnamed protein product [Darwinula stevensoni]CAG0898095.1 unnamed protein product [Darwinula stevensoni]